MLLQTARDAALIAGRLLLSHTSNVVLGETSHDTKLDADIAAEKAIIRHLEENSNFPVLSEEAGLSDTRKGPRWIVDPLDGTVNFSRSIPLCCVSIALWDNGPLLGVIYDFTRGELFSGEVDKGAWLNNKPIHVSDVKEASSGIIFTGIPVASDFGRPAIESLGLLVQNFKKVRLLGTAALSLAYVACGRGDAYMESKIRIWDVAAGAAIVQAAGGNFQMIGTDPVDLYASNGKISMV